MANRAYPLQLRFAVGALYVAYAVAIVVALAQDSHVYEVVSICLGLHLVGVVFALLVWGPETVYPEGSCCLSRVLWLWDVVQLVALVGMLSTHGDPAWVDPSAGLALVGVVLCVCKVCTVFSRSVSQ